MVTEPLARNALPVMAKLKDLKRVTLKPRHLPLFGLGMSGTVLSWPMDQKKTEGVNQS